MGRLGNGAKFNINGKQDVVWEYNGYDIVNADNETLHDIYTLDFLLEFRMELIEENTIDEIEELNYNGKTIFSIKPNDYDTRCGIVNVDIFSEMKDKLNEVVRGYNKLNKEIQSIKENA